MTSKKVRLRTIHQGPIRHTGLSAGLLDKARRTFATVGKLIVPTFEQWELGFLRDCNPDREIAHWEQISKAYLRYCKTHKIAEKNRPKIVGILAGIASGGRFEREDTMTRNCRKAWNEVGGGSWPIEVSLCKPR